jgi:peptide/nickel transport system substrate-binding protein
LRVANQGDALSMDPHSLNETLQISVVSNVYESLVTRGKDYKLAPSAGHLLEANLAHGVAL